MTRGCFPDDSAYDNATPLLKRVRELNQIFRSIGYEDRCDAFEARTRREIGSNYINQIRDIMFKEKVSIYMQNVVILILRGYEVEDKSKDLSEEADYKVFFNGKWKKVKATII